MHNLRTIVEAVLATGLTKVTLKCDTENAILALRRAAQTELAKRGVETLPEDGCEKTGRYAHTGPALAGRYRDFTRWLRARPERNIIVVAHHNVFLGLVGISFLNCEATRGRRGRRSAATPCGRSRRTWGRNERKHRD